ncbi:uncharacterized protein LOC141909645 [Tubulanus polymorphus]|uniref:uncharacterized protein LOC141909645 n=1 Tax=Tubulanus polymorphus TaxID=672921 RepID=UPI003DA4E4DD
MTTNYQQEPFPYGWEMLLDSTTGMPFYVDHVNQVTTWKDPRLDSIERSGQHHSARSQGPLQQSAVRGGGSYQSDGSVQIPIQRGGYSQNPPFNQQQQQQQQQWYPNNQPQPQQQHQYGYPPHLQNVRVTGPGYPTGPHESSRMTGYPTRPQEHSRMPVYPTGPENSGMPGYPTGPQMNSSMPGYPTGPQVNSRMPGYPAGPQQYPQMPFPTAPAEQNIKISHQVGEGGGNKQHRNQSENVITSDAIPVIREHKAAAAGDRPRSADMASKLRTDQLYADAANKKCASAASSPQVARKAKYQSLPPELASMEKVKDIENDTTDILEQVNHFNGKSKDKQYKYLEEMLTRNMISLDDVDSCGKDQIRQARKNCIRMVQSALDQLELKAFSNETGSGGTTEGNTNEQTSMKPGASSPTEEVVQRTEKQLNILSSGQLNAGQQYPSAGQQYPGTGQQYPGTGQRKTGSGQQNSGPTRVKEMTLNSEINC